MVDVRQAIRGWKRRGTSGTTATELGSDETPVRQAEAPRQEPKTPLPARPGLRAAVATGERLRSSLAWEWEQTAIAPGDWKRSLTATKHDLVLIEADRGSVPGWDAAAVSDLSAWCRQEMVPLILWVTADGDADALGGLVEAATLVFLADATTVDAWRAKWPKAMVDVLGPAAQPRLYRPDLGGPGDRRTHGGALVLEPGRMGLSSLISEALRKMRNSDFDIWTAAEQRSASEDWKAKYRGTCGWPTDGALVAQYRVLLDAGRADPSSSWTALEAAAAQTAVVTLPDQRATLPTEVAEHVAARDDEKSLRGEIVARIAQPELRDRESLRLHRAVLTGHTYGHRVGQILDALGRPAAPAARSVSAVAPTNRSHEIPNILANMGRQAHDDLELVLVLHGLEVKDAELHAQAEDLGVKNLTIVHADPSLTLGSCLNVGIDAAEGSYIAKIDDDNFYGAHYLTDMLLAFDYTDALCVGKWAHYVWLRSTGAVVLRYPDAEHTYERRIQGGSMLIDGELARDLRFSDIPRAVDSDFLDRSIERGVKIYSADRFNFVSVRGSDRHAHTWTVDDVTFMTKTGRLAFYGDPRQHVEV